MGAAEEPATATNVITVRSEREPDAIARETAMSSLPKDVADEISTSAPPRVKKYFAAHGTNKNTLFRYIGTHDRTMPRLGYIPLIGWIANWILSLAEIKHCKAPMSEITRTHFDMADLDHPRIDHVHFLLCQNCDQKFAISCDLDCMNGIIKTR